MFKITNIIYKDIDKISYTTYYLRFLFFIIFRYYLWYCPCDDKFLRTHIQLNVRYRMWRKIYEIYERHLGAETQPLDLPVRLRERWFLVGLRNPFGENRRHAFTVIHTGGRKRDHLFIMMITCDDHSLSVMKAFNHCSAIATSCLNCPSVDLINCFSRARSA